MLAVKAVILMRVNQKTPNNKRLFYPFTHLPTWVTEIIFRMDPRPLEAEHS